jgi:hypothetical protein
MKKFVTTLFVATIIILAAVYVLELNNSKKMQKQLDEINMEIKDTEQKLAVSKTETVKLNKTLIDYKEEVADLKSSKEELAAKVEQQIEKLEDVAAAATEEKKDESAGEKFASGLAEMMETPEMQETIRMQNENSLINPVFGDFIKNLGMDEMDTETFRNLLSHRFMIKASTGMKLMTSDKEQRAELAEQIKQEEGTVDAMIKEMLGEEKFKEFEGYKNTMGERMALNQFGQQLGMSGSSLTSEQNNQLITAMHEARLEAQKDASYFNAENADISDYVDESLQKHQNQQQVINSKTLELSKKILDDKQYEKFELFLINRQRQQEMQLKMAKKMFGKEKKD